MKTMLPRDYQMMLENKFSKSNIRTYILNDISECKELMDKLHICSVTIRKWAANPHYQSKYDSLAVLRDEDFDIKTMLVDVMSQVLTQSHRMEITAAVGLTLGFLPWSEPKEALKRGAEILYHMAACDIIDMTPAYMSETETVLINNKYSIGGDTAKYIQRAKFTPPMVCPPEIVKTCHDSGYLTPQKFSILKGKHKHPYPINTDSINRFNSIPLTLDIDFLTTVTEQIELDVNADVDIEERTKQFDKYTRETNETAMDIVRSGNVFYETHFNCGRGRTYSRAYHINSQGNSHRKAMQNFAEGAALTYDADIELF